MFIFLGICFPRGEGVKPMVLGDLERAHSNGNPKLLCASEATERKFPAEILDRGRKGISRCYLKNGQKRKKKKKQKKTSFFD